MKKNGFVFVETIIAVVILTGSLLLLYSSFTNLLHNEKTRAYYDDVNYIYRTEYIKENLKKINFDLALKDLNTDEEKDFITIGIEYESLFNGYENTKNFINDLFTELEVEGMLLIKKERLENLKKCNNSCLEENNCSNSCNDLLLNISEEMYNYLKTITVDIDCNEILIGEYNTCYNDKCHEYFSWVSV